jgi:hypothetical protein
MEHALLAPNWGGEEIAAINPVIAGGSVLKRGARGFHDHDVVADTGYADYAHKSGFVVGDRPFDSRPKIERRRSVHSSL